MVLLQWSFDSLCSWWCEDYPDPVEQTWTWSGLNKTTEKLSFGFISGYLIKIPTTPVQDLALSQLDSKRFLFRHNSSKHNILRLFPHSVCGKLVKHRINDVTTFRERIKLRKQRSRNSSPHRINTRSKELRRGGGSRFVERNFVLHGSLQIAVLQ